MSSRDDIARGHDHNHDRDPLGDQVSEQDGTAGIGQSQQPVTDERQHMPDTGNIPVPPDQDIMEEARDGFMDRYPPRGQTH